MKKLLTFIFSVCLIIPCMLLFSACANDPIQYKLSFVVDGEVYAVVDTAGEESISMPQNPTKDGYTFDGWYWDNETWQRPFTSNSLLNEPLSSDMKVYAKWRNDETLRGTQASFASFTKVDDTTYSIVLPNATELLNFSEVVEVNNKTSWKLTTDIYGNNSIASKIATLEPGNNVYYVLVSDEFENVKLYTLNIRRKPIYHVTINNQGGSPMYYNYDVEEGSEFDISQLFIPTRKGYTFKQWTAYNNPINSNTTIYAEWYANEYVVNLNHNGGSYAINSIPVAYNTYLPQQSLIPQKLGYTFNGYYSNNNEMYYDANMTCIRPYTITSNIELTAKYTINNYSIEYHLNGGTYSESSIKLYNVEMNNIQLSNPKKTGYDFVNWTLNGEIVTEVNTHLCENLVITANFKPIIYTITYIINGGVNDVENPQTYTIETPTIRLKPAIFENGNVSRWYTEESFNNRINYILKGSYGNKIIYARNGYDDNDVFSIKSNSITKINDDFINEFKITEIIIPEGITSINENVFINKINITSIKIPSTVTTMSSGMFSGCSSLKSISIPFIGESKNAAGRYALFGYIFGTKAYDGSTAIQQNYLSSDQYSTSYISLTYYIPTTLEEIEVIDISNVQREAFSGCSSLTSWTSLTIKSGEIPAFTFACCTNLTSVTMDKVTNVGRQAFENCANLTSLILSTNINLIDVGAFSGCSKLVSVIMPKNLKIIEYGIFFNCNLLTIYCEDTKKSVHWSDTWNAYNIPVYWYSEALPTQEGNYWHYGENGEIIIW